MATILASSQRFCLSRRATSSLLLQYPSAQTYSSTRPRRSVPRRSSLSLKPTIYPSQNFTSRSRRMAGTQKEAIVSKGPAVKIVSDAPIPSPGPDQVVIKNHFVGTNPKDWKHAELLGKVMNTGDDVAGTIHQVGENVAEFRVGDRVAGFHVMTTPHGAFAEYTLVPADTTFHIPKNTSYEEAATIPLAALTAAVALFQRLDLPEPWTGNRRDGQVKGQAHGEPSYGPLLIWGGASAIGAFAIKLAKHANVGPIIAVAGRGIPFAEGLLDKSVGDAVVDYRQDDDKVVAQIKEAANGKPILRCFDAVSEEASYLKINKAVDKGGKVTFVLPGRDYSKVADHFEHNITMVGDVHNGQTDFGFAWFRLLAKGLRDGWFTAHPFEVIPGGLNGVEQGLRNLKEGKASGVKYIYRISETK